MSVTRWSAMGAVPLVALALSACNEQRNKECSAFLTAIAPLQSGIPSVDTVKSVGKQLDGLNLTDETLKIYSTNLQAKLVVLSGTLELKAGSSPPDGTDEVIAANLKKARTDGADVTRYCSP